MDSAQERDAVRATIDRIEAASGRWPVGWLGAGLAETWNTLDYLAEAGVRYVCDWVNDDQPYLFEIGNPPLVSLPYSVQTNDVPAYFEMKVSVPEFEAMLRRQFDTLYREGETIPRVMAIAVHPFVTGQPDSDSGELNAPGSSRKRREFRSIDAPSRAGRAPAASMPA